MCRTAIRKILRVGLPSLVVIGVVGLFFFPIIKIGLHLDFSQEYRKVDVVDKIRFRDNWSGKVYGRAFWGLRAVERQKDEPSGGWRENAKDSYAVLAVGDFEIRYGYDAQEDQIFLGNSVGEIEETYDTQYNEVTQVELSPDGRYILYCEIEYDVNGGYSTDEENCYYRVIDRENGERYTIYSGYREWYQVYWEGS